MYYVPRFAPDFDEEVRHEKGMERLMKDAHIGSIENELCSDDWRFSCSCGAHGLMRNSEDAASADLDAHYKEVAVQE